ncbi:hypothetical protein N0V94_004200 [Neodidymelliopsis sp. IMI 364377]|nr:hypothetical protein N0V94_004200 [Neodidymelliopsis sp. IMI 364377]
MNSDLSLGFRTHGYPPFTSDACGPLNPMSLFMSSYNILAAPVIAYLVINLLFGSIAELIDFSTSLYRFSFNHITRIYCTLANMYTVSTALYFILSGFRGEEIPKKMNIEIKYAPAGFVEVVKSFMEVTSVGARAPSLTGLPNHLYDPTVSTVAPGNSSTGSASTDIVDTTLSLSILEPSTPTSASASHPNSSTRIPEDQTSALYVNTIATTQRKKKSKLADRADRSLGEQDGGFMRKVGIPKLEVVEEKDMIEMDGEVQKWMI